MRHQRSPYLNHKGFSLVEVVIAIGIVAVLLTSFIAVFGPAQQSVVRALGVGDVNRLTSTLENEMGYLRETEENDYNSAFDKAFEWLETSTTSQSAIIVYQYHGDPSTENADGTLKAKSSGDKRAAPGVDYITQTVARKLDQASSKSYIREELSPGVIVGGVYAVRLTQLVPDSTTGAMSLGAAGSIVDEDGAAVSGSDSYPNGYIAMQAEFYRLPNNLSGFVIGGGWDFENLGAPIVTQNIAVRN